MRSLLTLAFFLIILTVILCVIGHVFLGMPFIFSLKDTKKNSIFSVDWMDWLEKNRFNLIYDYVIPRKVRQQRYAHSHVAHFNAVIKDHYYDTNLSDHFYTRYTKLPNDDACAMHYYRTNEGEFFCMTSHLGAKDSFSAIPEKEMKKLLTNEPELYLQYIPHADENKDLQALVAKREEARKRQEEAANEEPIKEASPKDKVAQYNDEIAELSEALSKKKTELREAKKAVKEEAKKEPRRKQRIHINIDIGFGDSEAANNALEASETKETKNETPIANEGKAQKNDSTETKEPKVKTPTTVDPTTENKNPFSDKPSLDERHNEQEEETKPQKPKSVIAPLNTTSESLDMEDELSEIFDSKEENESSKPTAVKEEEIKAQTEDTKELTETFEPADEASKTSEKNIPEAKNVDAVEETEEIEEEVKEETKPEAVSEKEKEAPTEKTERPKKKREKIKLKSAVPEDPDIDFNNAASIEKMQEEEEEIEEPLEISANEEAIEKEAKKEEHEEAVKKLDEAALKMPKK